MVRDLEEAEKLADVIRGNASTEFFYQHFRNRISEGFDPEIHLKKIGVVNQTTMLATETQAIATLLKKQLLTVMVKIRQMNTLQILETHSVMPQKRIRMRLYH